LVGCGLRRRGITAQGITAPVSRVWLYGLNWLAERPFECWWCCVCVRVCVCVCVM
jgi:hypothetical protein